MTTQFSDEDLTAYLDGEAAPEVSRAIEMAVATDPGVAIRLDALSIDKDRLKAAFDALAETAPAAPSLPARPARRRWLAMAAAGVACVGLGYLAGQLGEKPQDWRDFAAAYHRLYVPQTLAGFGFSTEEKAMQMDIAGKAIGLTLNVAFAKTPDIALKRAQVLGFDGAAIAHLAYVTATGVPVALCISRSNDSATAMSNVSGMPAYYWNAGGHGFLLLGTLPEAQLKKIAADLGGPAA